MIKFKSEDDMSYLLRYKYGPESFDKERNKEIAGIMASSANTLIFLSSKSFEGDNMDKERWYSVPWMKEKYTSERIEAMKNASAPNNDLKLDLPPVNTLLPKNFDILPPDAEQS
jgi:secreted Zn-dependent insulinase-like peptidase